MLYKLQGAADTGQIAVIIFSLQHLPCVPRELLVLGKEGPCQVS